MKIATLQFNPVIGQVAANFSRAESLLMREERSSTLSNLDLLVLPELAFTGYNHPSLSAIAPCLEPTASGPSTRWASRTAKRLKCTVAVGYPEAFTTLDDASASQGNFNTIYDSKISGDMPADTVAYNSLVFVNSQGEVVAHYRKAFLYYTDENWAKEGGAGFYAGVLPVGEVGRKGVKVAAGICMDLNPYKFEAAWTAYEFANHAREVRAKVVVLSMAWLTRMEQAEMEAQKDVPDMDTVAYWVERLGPLCGPMGSDEEVVVVCANRTGEEGVDARIGEVRYAGSSCVMGLSKGDGKVEGGVRIWNTLGRGSEGLLIVDTEDAPMYQIATKPAASPVLDTPWSSSDRSMNGGHDLTL